MANFADRVFMNAKIYSVAMDGTETRAQALAIKDGKFAFIGSDEGVKEWIGEGTEVTDCNGGSILPGFCDAHMHYINSVQRYGVVDLNGLVTDPDHQTPDEIIALMQERIRDFAASHPDDPVIHGSGWDRTWFSGNLSGIIRPLTRHDIDAAVADRPVVLNSYCGHVAMFNTKALELAGAMNMPDPEAGIIRRDENGVPDGYIQEPVIILPLCMAVPGFNFTLDQMRNGMLTAQKLFHSRGFTYLSDCMGNDPIYGVVKKMFEDGELKLRIDGVYNINDATREQDLETAIAHRGMFDYEDLFKVDTMKYFVDGNLSMIEPFPDESCARVGVGKGERVPLLWNEANLMESMEKAQAAGFNIHVHGMGDYAAKYTIDCMANAQQKYNQDGKLRNILAHCYYVADEDKKRMGEYGIIASIQPQWQSESDESAPSEATLVGIERHHRAYPNKSLVDAGVVCAYGSDFTVTVPDGLEGIQVAMTRRMSSKDSLYEAYKDIPAMAPDECVSLKEALKGQTINGAYQFRRENITGSIELGKSAELVVLDGDIENTPVDKIVDLTILETVFKGSSVFKK